MWRIHLRLNRNRRLRAVKYALHWCGRAGYQPMGLFRTTGLMHAYPDEHEFYSDKSWWNYFNKSFSAPMLFSPYAFLLDFASGTMSSVISDFPESTEVVVRSSSVIWCAVCHAGMKGRSRAAERLLYCHMSPVVLAETPGAHCALSREQLKAQPLCHYAFNALAFKVAMENCF